MLLSLRLELPAIALVDASVYKIKIIGGVNEDPGRMMGHLTFDNLEG